MKVLFIHCCYQLAGGEDGVVSAEIELLRSNGMEVELLQFSNDGSTVLKLLQLPFNIGSYLKTRRHLKKFKPDVVHVHNMHFAASASVLYAVKKEKIPLVITLHNFRLLCPSATLFFKGKPYLKSVNSRFPWAAVRDGVYNKSKLLTFWLGVSNWINRFMGAWKLADRYIVLTEHAKGIFEKSSLRLNTNKVSIKPNFVYSPEPSLNNRCNNFLFIGRLSEEKGIQVMLDAFINTGHDLTIVGEGPLKALVESYAKDHPNITYLGFQKKDVITKELKTCSAVVFPSVWYETFGLTIVEAFATSTAVIASNIGSPSLLIKDNYNGLHFEPSSVPDLRNKLNKWQEFGDQQKAAYRKNARKTYEKYYTPDKNFEQVQSIYTSVIKEKNRTNSGTKHSSYTTPSLLSR